MDLDRLLTVATQLSGRRIFIASPGGLESERALIRTQIAAFNENRAWEAGVAFVPVGWEDVVGTVERPQHVINELLDECDFMLVLLHGRWGSPPGKVPYESGTQEEVSEGAKRLRDPDASLRDILFVFKAVTDREMADPGEQLSKVLRFRRWMEKESHQALFHTVDTQNDLWRCLDSALHEWVKPLGEKRVKQLDLPWEDPSDLDGGPEVPALVEPRDLVEKAEELAKQGLLTQAEVLFSRAVGGGDPLALSYFARFLRRRGRLDRAAQIGQQIVDRLALTEDSAERALVADALAQLGVIARKQGRLLDAKRALSEACRVARSAGPAAHEGLAYALDSLGWTCSRMGEHSEAVQHFEESSQLRAAAGDASGSARSALNLARMLLLSGDASGAHDRAEEALKVLDEGRDAASYAKGLAARGQALLQLGKRDAGLADLGRSLEINERIQNADGICVVSNVLARAALAIGDYESAARYASRVRLESETSSNREGQAHASLLFGQLDLAEERWAAAVANLLAAEKLAREIGDPVIQAATLGGLATAFAQVNRPEEAQAARERQQQLAKQGSFRADVPKRA